MDLVGKVWDWFQDPATWTGSGVDPGIVVRVYEHMSMSLQAVLLAALLALPAALYIGHRRRFEFLAVSIGNLGRALPSFGILGITFSITTALDVPGVLGFWATFVALVLLAIPPILTNTYVGIRSVDADATDAARGMGMTEGEILRKIEIPLAASLIVTGLRLAAVQVVATATLGALAAWGGLGRYIVDGFQAGDDVQLLGGAILVALLAIATEIGFGFAERLVAPKTRSARGTAPSQADGPLPAAT